MKVNFILLLLFLSLCSIFIAKDENGILTIEKATGNLYEYLNFQKIKLTMVPLSYIDPKYLYNLNLTRGSKSYKTPLNCIKAENQSLSVLVTCDIDLSQVPLGTYIISSFNYTNKSYTSTPSIKIKEIDITKISDIQIDNVYGNIKEYSLDSGRIYFRFSQRVNFDKLVTLKIEDENKNEYKLKLQECNSNGDPYEPYCYINNKCKAGTYKLIYIQYEKEIILPSRELKIILEKDYLEISHVYNEFTLQAPCTNKLNYLKFYFNDTVIAIMLSKIIFKNVKSDKIYEPRFEIMNNDCIEHEISIVFDFLGIPPGKYYINYIYKKKMFNSTFILEIKDCKPIDYSDLYEN